MVSNPEILYGPPITEAFQDEITGLWVQYFENVRMELHPDAPDGEKVQLTDVGKNLYDPAESAAVVDDSGNCRIYEPYNLPVCRSFLEFYEANGGVEQFGPPISSFRSLDGLIVQYFDKARFEFHPEYPPGARVRVSSSGKHFFDDSNEPSYLLLPVNLTIENPSSVLPELPQEEALQKLMVRAFPHQAVTGREASQIIYVIVQDQKRAQIENASVEAIVTYPSGKVEKYLPQLPGTNEAGVAKIKFPVSATTTGLIEITVKATYRLPSGKSVIGTTVTSFRVWQ